jgi:hypothetical protein
MKLFLNMGYFMKEYFINSFNTFLMKSLKVSLIILLLGVFMAIMDSCCNTETPPIVENKGMIAFYTNAHDLLPDDSVKVSVYLDSVLVGQLVKSGIGDSMDFNANTDSLLLIEKKVGSYSYFAKSNSVNPIMWQGTVKVVKDSLAQIPLNAMDVVDELTKVKFRLIGAWKDYTSEAQKVIFTRKDSVFEMAYKILLSSGSFKVITKDSIEVDRPTSNPKKFPRITKHNIIFSGNDSLKIKLFARNTTEVIPYYTRHLVRLTKNE